MLQVKPIIRAVIDAWPVAESGLPVRVVNSVAPAKVRTIGPLRALSDAELLAFRSLGRLSMGHIKTFFKLCNQIEQGRQSFQNVREVLATFLDEAEGHVLAARYGFDRKDLAASRNCATLQEIGRQTGNKTRERIRQIQDAAMRQLRSRLALVCLQPFVDHFASYLDNLDRVAHCAELAPLQNDPALAGCNICSILLLFGDLYPDRITFHNGFFSTMPLSVIQHIEKQALRALEEAGAPVPLDRILENVAPAPGNGRTGGAPRMVSCVLDHCPSVAATLDHRYFLSGKGSSVFLAEVLRDMPRPAHYRAVTNAFNDRLKPLSRRGAGFILELLNVNPQCTRVDRGIYDLKAG